ncbi:MAG: hypothetical protein KGH61_02030 [Candidatus Micrarchaeota archaeon]|nr:hypothetical protein [Candidatus Micrarchaeota archaeon]MDE1847709.1 hypothetical protein [Candidatus Micrarchaeota archaeon]MDE1864138.1 hypothetical protein [Candidatus Micrarchaeota archaeon]
MAFANKGFEKSSVIAASGMRYELLAFVPRSLREGGIRQAAKEISGIFGKAFYGDSETPSGWPAEKVETRLGEISLGYLVHKEGTQERIGYALFETIPSGAGDILYVASIGFSHQGLGLGRVLVQDAAASSQNRIVAARTQNPNLIKMLYGLKPKALLPIDEDYTASETNRKIFDALRAKNIQKHNADVELTGLCKQAYHEGKLGLYTSDQTDPLAMKILRRFGEIGLNQVRGDALMVAAKLDFI